MMTNPLADLAPKVPAVLAAVLIAGGAFAADLPSRANPDYYPAPPIFTWTGLYLGANGGIGFGHGTYGGNADFGAQTGALGGLTGGYNFQSGALVVGIEADLDLAGISGTGLPHNSANSNASITSLDTVRGRLGFAADHALFYVTGGYAGVNMRGNVSDFAANPNVLFNQSNYLNGYAVGLGLEYAITNRLSVKAEYLYSSFGAANYFGGTVDSISAGTHFSTLKAGLNYHF